jgi:hypothetical protein
MFTMIVQMPRRDARMKTPRALLTVEAKIFKRIAVQLCNPNHDRDV